MLKMTADVRLKASNKDDIYYRYSLHFPYLIMFPSEHINYSN